MVTFRNSPVCNVEECFGCEEKHCIILTKKDFGVRKCPFFKTREQTEKEKAYRKERLANITKITEE
jgi:hypothetical protein